MPARAYWKGHVRLSLVTFKVRLYAAVEAKARPRLREIHKVTGEPVRRRRTVAELGAVPDAAVGRGVEVEPGLVVPVEAAELERLRAEAAGAAGSAPGTIDLVQFVGLHEIDPIYVERPFYAVPDDAASEGAFRVLRDALRRGRKAALGQLELGGRERVAALRACGRGLVLEALRYGEEVRAKADFFAGIAEAPAPEEQVALAEALIERRTAPFDPAAFRDRYAAALRGLARAKLRAGAGAGAAAAPAGDQPAAGGARVIDLSDALRRSLGAEPRRGPARPRRGVPAGGAAGTAPASPGPPPAAA